MHEHLNWNISTIYFFIAAIVNQPSDHAYHHLGLDPPNLGIPEASPRPGSSMTLQTDDDNFDVKSIRSLRSMVSHNVSGTTPTTDEDQRLIEEKEARELSLARLM